jgi:predicted aconitase with swiveling domain
MEFKGRVILEGDLTAEAVVSRQGFNTLASCQKSAMAKKKQIICSDQNNPSIYNKNITGKILCLPKTIGSTTGGMVLQTVAEMGIAPAAMLFSEEIDSLAASGVILADIWNGHKIITVDRLGDDFLEAVQDGMIVDIKSDGTVILNKEK